MLSGSLPVGGRDGSVMYAWVPGVIDTLVPFLLGLGEGMMIATIGKDIATFLFFYLCTVLVAMAAGLNYARHARAGTTSLSRMSQQVIRAHPGAQWWLSGLGSVCIAAMWLSAMRWHGQFPSVILAWLCATLPLVYLASSNPRWSRPMRRAT